MRTDLAPDAVQHLRLDPEHDHVRVAHRVEIVGDRADPVLALEGLAALLSGMAGDHAVWLDEGTAEQAGDHRLGHDAGTDRRDRRVREGGHRPEYSDGAVRFLRAFRVCPARPTGPFPPVTSGR